MIEQIVHLAPTTNALAFADPLWFLSLLHVLLNRVDVLFVLHDLHGPVSRFDVLLEAEVPWHHQGLILGSQSRD